MPHPKTGKLPLATMCARGESVSSPSGPPKHGGEPVGTAAIKWGAVVIIVVAILWFLARHVIPLFG